MPHSQGAPLLEPDEALSDGQVTNQIKVMVGDSSHHSNSSGALDAWRQKANKIILMQRMLTSKSWREAGLDLQRHNYDHLYSSLSTRSKIFCVDLSSKSLNVEKGLTSCTLSAFLDKERPSWSKVRWINVQGLSWDVVQQLARRYHLHPLAVEDVVHYPQRVKVDYYENHMFLSMIVVALEETDDGRSPLSLRHQLRSHLERLKDGPIMDPSALQAGVVAEQASMFLLRDGTLITIFQTEGGDITAPILERLKSQGTLISDSEDVSFLMHTIIDAIVDLALPVRDMYARRIADLEAKVLLKQPRADYTTELHLLQNDLHILRRTFLPTQKLMLTLRERVDSDRHSFITPLTQDYLADVQDHANSVTEDLDLLGTQCRDLINLVFNTIQHQQNRAMQTLANVSAVFLPITFVAGVYGTNFDFLPEYHWHLGYVYFWSLCILITIAFIYMLQRLGMFKT